MTEIKILATHEGSETYRFMDKPKPGSTTNQGTEAPYYRFISQETITVNNEKVPKWEILVRPDHPEWKKLENSMVEVYERDDCFYEISFVNSEELTKKSYGVELDKRLRFFEKENDITIVSNFYSYKLEELKKLDNLIPGEEQRWKNFIAWFCRDLNSLTNEDTDKYQKGKKFIEELKAELNKKTGKGNDDNRPRERERERQKNWETPQANC